MKAKANQRLIEMIMPAMRELRRVLDSKTASDADKLKAVNMVLQRTGFNERHQIDIGLREPSPWERLTGADSTAFRIERGREAVIDPDDDPPALLGRGGNEDTDEALTALLDQRERERAREASTRISNEGHDVVRGDVIGDETQRRAVDPFRVEEKERAEFARRRTEFDPEPVRPEGPAWERYEERVREGVEERRR
ncbi:hypothetical protein [Nocardioides antri]|uniref:Uncharacterized protein n=1 Tax=Nocardioides antri TaxID=2607659 RepID=A0A5B1LR21_9ACTN|nr:hypothetical protein [Nocardioides antri]KAA1423192.1 hypothetical protein F0U47_20155 [Nocardioides antri]